MPESTSPPRPGGVQSVERAFVLLEALARHDRPLGITELVGECGLSQATTHRLLRTLVDLGYVRQEPSRSYALGPGCLRLGERATTALAASVRPRLERVARELGESVNLAVRDGDRAVYLAHVSSQQSVRTFTEVGSRVPLHSTGVGKAILAPLDPDEVRAVAARAGLPADTSYSLTDVDDLVAELAAVREAGHAMDEQEHELGVRCVAVPVPGSAPAMALSMSGPAARVTDDVVRRALPLLQEIAADLARS